MQFETLSEKKKKIMRTSRLLMIGAFVLLFFVIPSARAEEDLPHIMIEQINCGIFEVINNNLYNSTYYTWVTDPNNAMLRGIYLGFKGIAAFIVIIYAITRLLTHIEHGQDPQEAVYKILVEIGVSGMLVMAADKIVDVIAQLSGILIDIMIRGANVADTNNGITLTSVSGAESGGWLWWIQCVLMLFIPYIASLLAEVAAQFVAFTILMELAIRRTFVPFAIADAYGEGLRSPGVKYLKKYIATYMKVGICILCCAIGTAFIYISAAETGGVGAANTAGSVLHYLFRVIAIEFTAIGIMVKGGDFANDALGV